MAYQNVATPRFYVNVLEWLHSTGQNSGLADIYRTSPINGKKVDEYVSAVNNFYELGNNPTHNTLSGNGFIAVLGHQFGGKDAEFIYQGEGEGVGILSSENVTNVVNFNRDDNEFSFCPKYDGFSIGLINSGEGFEAIELKISENYSDAIISSCIIGNYYEMPHSPDLNLTMTREYGGTKTLETRGGATLTNSYWTKQPNWGNGLPAWHLYKQANDNAPELDNLAPLAISGRRVWNLSFSYLQDQDMFPEISNLTNYEHRQPASGLSNNNTTPYDGDYYLENEQDDYDPVTDTNAGFGGSSPRSFAFLQNASNKNFISEVLHKTNGGALPFVFQPDSSNANPDQFAICMFDQNSFQFKQVANGVYNISMKIREVW